MPKTPHTPKKYTHNANRGPFYTKRTNRFKFVYPGKVLVDNTRGKWQVRVRTPYRDSHPDESRQHYIGSYYDEEEAARAADRFVIQWMVMNPDSVRILKQCVNFPEESEHDFDPKDLLDIGDITQLLEYPTEYQTTLQEQSQEVQPVHQEQKQVTEEQSIFEVTEESLMDPLPAEFELPDVELLLPITHENLAKGFIRIEPGYTAIESGQLLLKDTNLDTIFDDVDTGVWLV